MTKYFGLLFLFFALTIRAQDSVESTIQDQNNEPTFFDKLSVWPIGFGGFYNANGLITSGWYLNGGAILAYQATERLTLGAGLQGNYERINLINSNSLNLFSYGTRAVARFSIFPRFFGQAEYEVWNVEIDENVRTTRYAILVGPGIMYSVGRTTITLVALYNVNRNSGRSFYAGNFVPRVGLNFAL